MLLKETERGQKKLWSLVLIVWRRLLVGRQRFEARRVATLVVNIYLLIVIVLAVHSCYQNRVYVCLNPRSFLNCQGQRFWEELSFWTCFKALKISLLGWSHLLSCIRFADRKLHLRSKSDFYKTSNICLYSISIFSVVLFSLICQMKNKGQSLSEKTFCFIENIFTLYDLSLLVVRQISDSEEAPLIWFHLLFVSCFIDHSYDFELFSVNSWFLLRHLSVFNFLPAQWLVVFTSLGSFLSSLCYNRHSFSQYVCQTSFFLYKSTSLIIKLNKN